MSNLKKIVALVLAMALVMTMFAGAAIKADLSKYTDGEEFTAAQKDALALVNALGVIHGVADDEIGTKSLTRAELVTVLYGMTNGTTEGAAKYGAPAFTDVAADNWAAGYVAWASLKGVVKGVSATEFAPNAKVTPIQAAAMLARLFDANACMDPATFAQDAQVAAIKYGLLNGITTADFFAKAEIARGDMFVMIANALKYVYNTKGDSLLTTVFDVEVIDGAVLMGVTKSYYPAIVGGRNKELAYSVFTFKTYKDGHVINFASNLLCVEEKATADEIGCKYTLYVAKNKTYNGFAVLYAAYEMNEDKYYNVVEGTVGDGKLVFAGDDKNVYFDHVATGNVYVDGSNTYVENKVEKNYTIEQFKDYYTKQKNNATYKLIDNDGDGYIEYAFINRAKKADLGASWVTGNVTMFDAKKGIYAIDGIAYNWGNYYEDGELKSVEKACKALLGDLKTAISDVKYNFLVGDGYIYDVDLCDATQFYGSYGVVLDVYPFGTYKNMIYASFLNEKNETVSAYVASVNNGTGMLVRDKLVYFTNWSEDGEVCSVYTADYDKSNYVYNLTNLQPVEIFSKKIVGVTPAYFDKDLTEKDLSDVYVMLTTDQTAALKAGAKPVSTDKFGYDYTTDDKGNVKELTWTINGGTYGAGTYQAYKYSDLAGNDNQQKYNNLMANGGETYSFVKVSKTDVTLKANVALNNSKIQVYRANGYWGYRHFGEIGAIGAIGDTFTLTVGKASYTIYKGIAATDGSGADWTVSYDGNDPNADAGDKTDNYVNISADEIGKELVKALNNGNYTTADAGLDALLDMIKDELRDLNNDTGTYYITKQNRAINVDYGVIFLKGKVSKDAPAGQSMWRAYYAEDINADYDIGMDITVKNDDGNYVYKTDYDLSKWASDEIICVDLKGVKYVKAAAIKGNVERVLPTGWIKSGELVVYVGDNQKTMTGPVWEYAVLDKDYAAKTIVSDTMLKNLKKGDLLLVYTNDDGVVTDLIQVTSDKLDGTIEFLNEATKIDRRKGKITGEGSYKGTDGNGNYYTGSYSGNTIYVYDGDIFTAYNKDWAGKDITVAICGAYNVIYVK